MSFPATNNSNNPATKSNQTILSRRSIWIATGIGILIITLTLFGLWAIREKGMAAYDTPEAREDWEAWRAAVANGKAGDQSVKRRIPKSPEPPTLVLLRDHFVVCASLVVVTEAALFATIAFMFIGSVKSKPHESI